jgi:hypothetical protein
VSPRGGSRTPRPCGPRRSRIPAVGGLIGVLLAVACAQDLPLAPRAEISELELNLPLGVDSAFFHLRNLGGEPLEWEAIPLAFPGSITLVPTGGVVPPRDSMSVLIRVEKSGMPLGEQTLQVRIQTNGFLDPTVTLNVDVPPHPAVASGGDPVPFPEQEWTFRIRNSGTGVLHWEAESREPWLTLHQTSGAVEGGGTPGQAVGFSIDRDQVPTDRVAEILITSNAAHGPVTAEILVHGNPPPRLVYPGAEHFEGPYYVRGNDLLWPGGEISLPDRPLRIVDPDGGHPPVGVVLEDAVFLTDPHPGILIEPGYPVQDAASYLDGLFLIPRDHPSARLDWYLFDEETITTHDLALPPLKSVFSPGYRRLIASTEDRLLLLMEEGGNWTVADQIESVPFEGGDGHFYWIEGEDRDLILTSGGYATSLAHGAVVLGHGGPMGTSDGAVLSELRNFHAFGWDSIRVVAISSEDPEEPGLWTFPRADPLGLGVRYVPSVLELDGEEVRAVPVEFDLYVGRILRVIRRVMDGTREGSLFRTEQWRPGTGP